MLGFTKVWLYFYIFTLLYSILKVTSRTWMLDNRACYPEWEQLYQSFLARLPWSLDLTSHPNPVAFPRWISAVAEWFSSWRHPILMAMVVVDPMRIIIVPFKADVRDSEMSWQGLSRFLIQMVLMVSTALAYFQNLAHGMMFVVNVACF